MQEKSQQFISNKKKSFTVIVTTIPSYQELDMFHILAKKYTLSFILPESLLSYVQDISWSEEIQYIALQEYEQDPSFLPGLEKALKGQDIVLIKERIGIYAYQVIKAKWQYQFHLIVWVDNQLPFPADDIQRLNMICQELNRMADGFLVQTRGSYDALCVEGVDKEKIYFLPPAVKSNQKCSYSLRESMTKKIGLVSSNIVISHIGDQEWESSLTTLIYAISYIKKRENSLSQRLKVILCGFGSLSQYLKDKVLSMNLDSDVIFLSPNKQNYEILLMISEACFFAARPAKDRLEGNPYPILLPMVSQIPIIASRHALVEEYIGKYRFDYCPESVSSLTKAIDRLIKDDKKVLYHDIVAKNKANIDKLYTHQKMEERIMDMIIEISNKVVNFHQSDLNFKINSIELKIKDKKYLEAIDLIENMIQIPQLSLHHQASLYRLIGDCFTKLADLEAGKDSYIKAIEKDPYLAKGYIGLGTIGLKKKVFDMAILNFQKAISFDPRDDMAYLGLGLAFEGIKELDEAMKWVIQALEINIHNVTAIYTCVKLSTQINDYDKCIEILKKYLQLHPSEDNFHYTLAGIYYRLQKWEESFCITDRLLKTSPKEKRFIDLHNKNCEQQDFSKSELKSG